jgi:hypothetical protein
MTKTVENLLQKSGLPGPRGNLTLLYSFVKNATLSEVNECLPFSHADLENSPEEFVAMCGIVGYCILNQNKIKGMIGEIRRYKETARNKNKHIQWIVKENLKKNRLRVMDEEWVEKMLAVST